jgi:hypothetical protein
LEKKFDIGHFDPGLAGEAGGLSFDSRHCGSKAVIERLKVILKHFY